MSVEIIVDGRYPPIKPVVTRFSDGSSNINIGDVIIDKAATIVLSTRTPCDAALWEILQARSAIIYAADNPIFLNLRMNYLPHARADRKFNTGDAVPLAAFLEALDGKFSRVIVEDPHNEEALRTFLDEDSNKIQVEPQGELFLSRESLLVNNNTLFIAPDKGALEKIPDLMEALEEDHQECAGYICADKVRNKLTGQIVSIELNDSEKAEGKDCVIVDDICDGGGTFIPLAKKLKESGAKSVTLYVTHGIFAKGLQLFRPHIDRIVCHNHVGTYINHVDLMAYNNGEEVK